MSTKTFKYKPIYAGFEWGMTLRVDSSEPLFPEGVELRADIRVNPESTVIASLSTAAGELVRVDDNRVRITIPGAKTEPMLPGAVVTDLVRTDTATEQHLGIRVRVPVERSATRSQPTP